MTVLVGVLCSDGVVIGSDSSTTFSAGSMPTIEQKDNKKTFVIRDSIVFAGTGQVGLCQRFRQVLDGLPDLKRSPNCHGIDLGVLVTEKAIQNFSRTCVSQGAFGALLAYAGAEGRFGLIEFDVNTLQPEVKTEDIWFVSMGSGQAIVDPLFGLLRRTLFRDSLPKLNEGIFAVVLALQQAIQLNTGGIDAPMQVGVIGTHSSGRYKEARLLSDDELSEHQANVDSLSDYIADYRNRISGGGTDDNLLPPEPPN